MATARRKRVLILGGGFGGLYTALQLEKEGSRGQPAPAVVKAVESVGMTVSDMEHAIDFYSKVLAFEKVSDIEVWGNPTSGSRACSDCACASQPLGRRQVRV